jgi:hypothetical protein
MSEVRRLRQQNIALAQDLSTKLEACHQRVEKAWAEVERLQGLIVAATHVSFVMETQAQIALLAEAQRIRRARELAGPWPKGLDVKGGGA